MKEMLGGCSVCCDDTGWTENPLVYCDGPNCNVAVHQGKFAVISTVVVTLLNIFFFDILNNFYEIFKIRRYIV